MNRKAYIRYFLAGVLTIPVLSWAQDAPKATLSNRQISAQVYLPDPEKGYYRASRFDWAGIVYQLNFKGHSYFGQWFDSYDPFLHEAIMGPVEAFDPLAYDQAKPGEAFTKIGVGLVKRMDTMSYHFAKPYVILDHGKWSSKQRKGQIEFMHELTAGTYPYRYKKVIRLNDNKLVIDHTLINLGSSAIETSVFNHNFFYIDEKRIGPGYRVLFPFEIKGDASGLGEFAVVNGKEVLYKKELQGNQRARIRVITGYSMSADDYDISIENTNSGAGVRIRSDKPMSRLLLWSAPKAVCPEPYTKIQIEPNKSFSWSIIYEFYTL